MSDEQPQIRLADGRLVYRGGRIVEPATGYSGEPFAPAVDVTPHVLAGQHTPPPATDAHSFEVHTRRHLKDIPDTTRNANACAIAVAYKLFGLDDFETQQALGISEVQLERIRESETYVFIHGAIITAVLDAETDNVRDVFRQHARTAANVLVDTLYNGTRGERTSAAKDFLDRSGHRPVDIVEHRHRMEGGLVIEVVRKNRDEQAPTIEMEIPQ
jgi:hypothetical protein